MMGLRISGSFYEYLPFVEGHKFTRNLTCLREFMSLRANIGTFFASRVLFYRPERWMRISREVSRNKFRLRSVVNFFFLFWYLKGRSQFSPVYRCAKNSLSLSFARAKDIGDSDETKEIFCRIRLVILEGFCSKPL